MNKIMLAAVAASFVSTAASAHSVQLPAEGQVCSDIHSNISVGINNPELSDYRKCVMIQHGIDTAFTYKTFWVRTGTEFTSFAVEDLAKMNRGERVEYIESSIHKAILEAELTKQMKAYDDLILELQTGFATVQAELLAAHAADLQAAVEARAALVEAHAAVVAAKDIEITRLEGELAAERATTLQLFSAGIAQADRITKLEGQVAMLNAQIASGDTVSKADVEAAIVLDYDGNYDLDTLGVTISVSLNTDGSVRYVEINNIQNVVTAGNDDAYAQGRANGIAEGKANAADNPINDSRDSTVPGFTTKEPGANEGSVNADTAAMADGSTTIYSIVVNNVEVGTIIVNGFSSINDLISEGYEQGFADGFADGFEAGYDKGYRDGYDDGYHTGYSDGFNDGVASVR